MDSLLGGGTGRSVLVLEVAAAADWIEVDAKEREEVGARMRAAQMRQLAKSDMALSTVPTGAQKQSGRLSLGTTELLDCVRGGGHPRWSENDC
jgi:hypothetical protein